MDLLSVLTCPVCGGVLRREGKSLLCEAGHNFDIARSGYANMLPPGKEKNARTGDEKNMVRARVDFLALGYYDRISRTAAELCAAELRSAAELHSAADPDSTAESPAAELLFCDMGCGEGYHSCLIAETAAEVCGVPVTMIGFDASKYAAECACKLAMRRGMLSRDGVGAAFDGNVQACFLPGNLFRLPLKEHSADAAFSLFAPIAGEETRRILKPGGILAVVSSGRDHLSEMRELIYSEVRKSDAIPDVPDGFAERRRQRLTYPIRLGSREEIASLFMMTPFWYKTTEAGSARLLSRESLDVTVDVEISLFEAR